MSSGDTTEKDKTETPLGPHHGNLYRNSTDSLSNADIHDIHTGGLSHLAEIVRSLSSRDAEARCLEEAADNGIPDSNYRLGKGDDHAIKSKSIVSWEEGDQENPHNWTRVCTLIP